MSDPMVPPTEADRQFLDFQRTGNPRALARVFDRLAGELLLLANHLSPDSSTAEDLLQVTFLEAIRCADTFEMQRGVKPWLTGILTNQARMEWRRVRRTVDPRRLRSEAVKDPAFEAEAREFYASLRAALSGMPGPYREVVRLGLLHGMSLGGIAESLGESREAIKSRWRRGMEMLRKKLPSGIALGALIAMTPGRGLAAVRETVVTRAELALVRGAPAATATGIGKLLLAAAALLVSALLGWQALVAEDEVPGAGGPTHRTANAAAVEASEESTARTPIPPIDPVEARTGSLDVRLSGPDGFAARGIRLAVRPVADGSTLREREATSDERGAVQFTGLRPAAYFVRLDRGHEVQATVRAGKTTTVRIELPAGATLQGRVFDKLGEPLVGARIVLAAPGRTTEYALEAACTDTAGNFTISHVQPGTAVCALADGHLGPRWGIVHEEALTQGIELHCRGRGVTVSGLVRDTSSNPARGVAVLAGHVFRADLRETDAQTLKARTDEQGRFRLTGVDPRQPLPLWIRSGTSCVHVQRIHDLDGNQELRVTLEVGATVQGTVRSASGVTAGVRIDALQGDVEVAPLEALFTGPSWARIHDTSGPAGEFTVTNIRPGSTRVRARDPRHGSCSWNVVLHSGERLHWSAELSRGRPILGRVVDSLSLPVADCRVTLAGGEFVIPEATTTDEDGRFVFRYLEDEDYTLLIQPPDPHGQLLHRRVTGVRPSQTLATFVISRRSLRSSGVSCTLRGPGGTPIEEAAFVVLPRGRNFAQPARARVKSDRGWFRLHDLLPGPQHVLVQAKGLGTLDLGIHQLQPGQVLELGHKQFETPAFLTFEVLDADGTRSSLPHVYLYHHTDVRATNVRLSGGRGKTRALQPGTHCAGLWLPGHLPIGRAMRIPAGSRANVRIELAKGGRPVTFVHRGIRGKCFYEMFLQRNGEPLYAERRTDDFGEEPYRIERNLNPGTYEFQIRTEGGMQAQAEFTVPETGDIPPVELEFR